MTKNPLTFRDIDPQQADPHIETPINSVIGGNPADEVHNQGEVWCVTLWEARARLIQRYGWETGNRLILQLVTDGMNLSPANPNFLQARDAILQAVDARPRHPPQHREQEGKGYRQPEQLAGEGGRVEGRKAGGFMLRSRRRRGVAFGH